MSSYYGHPPPGAAAPYDHARASSSSGGGRPAAEQWTAQSSPGVMAAMPPGTMSDQFTAASSSLGAQIPWTAPHPHNFADIAVQSHSELTRSGSWPTGIVTNSDERLARSGTRAVIYLSTPPVVEGEEQDQESAQYGDPYLGHGAEWSQLDDRAVRVRQRPPGSPPTPPGTSGRSSPEEDFDIQRAERGHGTRPPSSWAQAQHLGAWGAVDPHSVLPRGDGMYHPAGQRSIVLPTRNGVRSTQPPQHPQSMHPQPASISGHRHQWDHLVEHHRSVLSSFSPGEQPWHARDEQQYPISQRGSPMLGPHPDPSAPVGVSRDDVIYLEQAEVGRRS